MVLIPETINFPLRNFPGWETHPKGSLLWVLEGKERKLDGCIVWNANSTVLGKEALLIYIIPVCYVKTRFVWKDLVISLLVYTGKKIQLLQIFHFLLVN